MYLLARAMQLVGLLILPVAMAMQLHGMSLWRMLLLAGVGVALFYSGYLLQGQVRE